jgi:hypothetical protein
LSVKLCSLFCEHKNPELNEEWFMENTSALQIKPFSDAIQEALMHAYDGINQNPKNLKAARKRSH